MAFEPTHIEHKDNNTFLQNKIEPKKQSCAPQELLFEPTHIEHNDNVTL